MDRRLKLVALGMGAILGASSALAPSLAEEAAPTGGTVHVPAFDLPLSGLLSPEARAYFSENPASPPAMGAPPAQSQEEYNARQRAFMDRAGEQYGRPLLERALQQYPVNITATTIGGVPVEVFEPRGGISPRNQRRVLINLRGGSFGGIGSVYINRLASIPVASIGGIRVVSVLYRQTSQRHPSATQDIVDVYNALRQQVSHQNIGIYGCSAGGMMTALTTTWLIDRNLPLPGAISITGTGLGVRAAPRRGDSAYFSAIANGRTPGGEGGSSRRFEPFSYFADANPDDRLINPLGDQSLLSRFPPTLLMSSTRDGFSSTIEGHRALHRAGVETSFHLFDGLPHCFYAYTFLPEAQDWNETTYRFFDRHLGYQ